MRHNCNESVPSFEETFYVEVCKKDGKFAGAYFYVWYKQDLANEEDPDSYEVDWLFDASIEEVRKVCDEHLYNFEDVLISLLENDWFQQVDKY